MRNIIKKFIYVMLAISLILPISGSAQRLDYSHFKDLTLRDATLYMKTTESLLRILLGRILYNVGRNNVFNADNMDETYRLFANIEYSLILALNGYHNYYFNSGIERKASSADVIGFFNESTSYLQSFNDYKRLLQSNIMSDEVNEHKLSNRLFNLVRQCKNCHEQQYNDKALKNIDVMLKQIMYQ